MNDFLAMGGYGAYVWSAIGITLGVLAGNALWARARLKQALRGDRGLPAVTEATEARRPTVVEQV